MKTKAKKAKKAKNKTKTTQDQAIKKALRYIESAKRAFEFEPGDIEYFIDQALKTLKKAHKVTSVEVTIDYPINKTFTVRGLKPQASTKEGIDKVRTKILQRYLAKQRFKAPHVPTDFVVELVEPFGAGEEFWLVGS